MNGLMWLWLAYRAFDAIYFLNILNAFLFLFTGTASVLVPILALLTVVLELYLNYLLEVHGINDNNLDDLS